VDNPSIQDGDPAGWARGTAGSMDDRASHRLLVGGAGAHWF